MRSVVFAFIFAVILGLSFAQQSDVYIIDSFDAASEPLVVVISGSTVFPDDETTFVQNANIFTGERDHELVVESGPSGMVFSSSCDGGEFTSSAPSSGNAYTLLQYDGTDQSLALNPSGGFTDANNDFTSNSAFAFHIRLSSDQPTSIEIFVYSGSESSFCSAELQVTGSGVTDDYIAEFNDFSNTGSGCDFSNVGAVELLANLPNTVDLIVELFATYGNVASTPTATRSPSPAPSRNPCDCICPHFHCVLEYDFSGVYSEYFDISVLNFESGTTQTNSNTNSDNTSNNSSSDAASISAFCAIFITLVALLI